MSRRVLVLSAVALMLLAVWVEFGVASPWDGQIRVAYADYQLRRLRSRWRSPCHSAGWSRVELQGVAIPVPECLEYELRPSFLDDAGPFLIAYDRNSADTHLFISVHTVPQARTDNIRAAAQRVFCSVIRRDSSVLMWKCLDSIDVLVSDKWLYASLATPPYLTPEIREREAGILIEVAEEFLRLQGIDDRPR